MTKIKITLTASMQLKKMQGAFLGAVKLRRLNLSQGCDFSENLEEDVRMSMLEDDLLDGVVSAVEPVLDFVD